MDSLKFANPSIKLAPLKSSVYFNNFRHQNLCFRQSLIRYILDCGNEFILRKLFASCKFFFFLQKSPLCYNLNIYGKESNTKTFIKKESINFNEKYLNFKAFKNLHIYYALFIEESINRNILSRIISKIYKCTVRYIKILCQDITVTDLKFLLSDYCKSAIFLNVFIYENQNIIFDGEKLFLLSKEYANLKIFKFINDDCFICYGIDEIESIAKKWKKDMRLFNFEKIYLKDHKCTISDFGALLCAARRLKHYKFENMIILNKSGKPVMTTEAEIDEHIRKHNAVVAVTNKLCGGFD